MLKLLNSNVLIFRPYNPQDIEICHQLFEKFKQINETLKLPLRIGENLSFITEDSEIDESEILNNYCNTLIFTRQITRYIFLHGFKNPGMGKRSKKSILISNLNDRYQIHELEGIILHEVGETLFGLYHHPPVIEPCAMADLTLSLEELTQATMKGNIETILQEFLDRCSAIPLNFCSKCWNKIKTL